MTILQSQPLAVPFPSPGRLDACPAPAKINLFLHVTGRRADGYHLLQTAFRLLDWGDTLDFAVRGDGLIRRVNDIPGVAEEADLAVRAARRLQQVSACGLGVDIAVHKRLPMGGGLGGGSSDAATTLMALDRLWGTGFGQARLREIALGLGADVPFFIYGRDAFAEGIGESLQPLDLPPAHYVIVDPAVSVPTAEIFSSPELTRNTPPVKVRGLTLSRTCNDLQPVACARYPEVGEAISWLGRFAPARMTGSGACVFAMAASVAHAEEIVARCPARWRAWQAASLARHPMHTAA
ncbi:MAG: 4-(cytidine 5'-diphospho)-2-C-methyl-D-erythritol kinase [Azoarcus sp.]|jgi:4-diphosphocytidyl-2-C-methyl-D-erythritol kinase|nr:4-(cytidine 5'-diphospho)-2-C-methyl-D-erythritol kinase [Azoarcus sp.]